jgi:UDP-N-acetylmuramyl tripeptide synthase
MKKIKKEILKHMLMKRIDHQKSIIKGIRKNKENIMAMKKVMKSDILVKRIKVIQKYQIMIVNRFMVIINSKTNGLPLKRKIKIKNMNINIAET